MIYHKKISFSKIIFLIIQYYFFCIVPSNLEYSPPPSKTIFPRINNCMQSFISNSTNSTQNSKKNSSEINSSDIPEKYLIKKQL